MEGPNVSIAVILAENNVDGIACTSAIGQETKSEIAAGRVTGGAEKPNKEAGAGREKAGEASTTTVTIGDEGAATGAAPSLRAYVAAGRTAVVPGAVVISPACIVVPLATEAGALGAKTTGTAAAIGGPSD